MRTDVLHVIFLSPHIHLTFSQKEFVKETIKILNIFCPKIEKIILEKFNKIISPPKNKDVNTRLFLDFIYSLRYPISWEKIKKLKKINKSIPSSNLEFDEKDFFKKDLRKIKSIMNEI